MAKHPLIHRRRVEAVANIIGRSHGFEPTPGHDEGEFPIQAMAAPKLVDGKIVPENPRARAWVQTAQEIVRTLARKEFH